MKKLLKVCLGMSFIPMILVGCSSDPAVVPEEPTTYTYTAEDIKYYKNANEVILQSNSVEFKKQYEGYCAVALANIDSKCGPVLVGEDPVQVTYFQSSKNKIYGSAGSVEVGGKTYYYSSADGFVTGKFQSTVKYDQYVSTYSNLEDIAKDLATKATFEAVDEAKKVYFEYKKYADEDIGGYEISAGPYAQTIKDLVIPATYKGEKVTVVAEAGFKGLPNLKTLRFEGKNIKILGKQAFHSNPSLKYVLLPDSLKEVGAWAFDVCHDELLVFNGAVDDTGYGYQWLGNGEKPTLERAFWEYKDYYVEDDYVYGLKNDDTIAVVRYRGEETNIVLPTEYNKKPVTIVEKFAFKGKNKIVDVTFHSGIKHIGREAFDSCLRLKTLVLPEGVEVVERSAFNSCEVLEYVILPESLKDVGAWAFDNCDNLSGIYCSGEKGSFKSANEWSGGKKVYYKGEWSLGENGVPQPNK